MNTFPQSVCGDGILWFYEKYIKFSQLSERKNEKEKLFNFSRFIFCNSNNFFCSFVLYLQLDKIANKKFYVKVDLSWILRKRILNLHCPMVHKNVFPHKFILLRRTFRGTVIHSTITILHMFVHFNFCPQ